jgi:hypothetical protein
MKVRIIKRGGYGDRYGIEHPEGSIVDFPDHLAVKLINHRIAEPVRDKPKERAVKGPREKTSKTLTTKAFFGES